MVPTDMEFVIIKLSKLRGKYRNKINKTFWFLGSRDFGTKRHIAIVRGRLMFDSDLIGPWILKPVPSIRTAYSDQNKSERPSKKWLRHTLGDVINMKLPSNSSSQKNVFMGTGI